MIKNYLKTALRNLLRNRIYSLINIVGLSLGLASAMLIMLYVKDERSYDRFHKNKIYRVILGLSGLLSPKESKMPKMGITGYFQGPKFAAEIPEIKSFVRVQSGAVDIKTGADIKYQQIFCVDSNFFSVFSFPLLAGDPKTVLLQPNSIVISEDLAKQQFGTTDATGKTILLKKDDKLQPYTVTGVAKRCPQNSSIKFQGLLPFIQPPEADQNITNWFSFFLQTYVVLAPNADVKTVQSKMQQIYKHDARELIAGMERENKIKDRTSYMLQPFTEIHLGNDISQEDIADASKPLFSYLLSGIAIFILLIACINFVNLTVARSLKRAKEIGIRKVAGSNRKQLITQFLGESFILCLLAFVLAIGIVQLTLPGFSGISNKFLSLAYLRDVKLLLGYVSLLIVTGFLAGFYPALVLSGFNPVQTLYNRFTLQGKNYFQKGLVILQFALASFLIIATVIIFSQFNFLTTEKLGYDDSELVLVNKNNLKRDEVKLLRQELMKSAGIAGVAPKDAGYSFNGAKINGDSMIGFANVTIDESYLPLLKIPIIKGRNFSKDFPSDSSHSVIVNEALVRKAGWKEPLGQQVSFNKNEKYTVIGVVKDYHFQSLSEEIVPELFSMKADNEYGMAYIKIKPKSETSSLNDIEKVFRKLFPLNPYSYIFKDQENLKNYGAEAKWKQIMLYSAILTIFISCIGLFGLSVLSSERRTKEVGIRKVLGASINSIITILSKDFLKLVSISLLVAIPIAWIVANKWLQNYPYRITLSWMMFGATALLVTFIALATVSFQAIKTAIANPVKSLRTE